MNPPIAATTLERFEKKVEKLPVECGCWLWTGGLYYNGYGQFAWDNGHLEGDKRVGSVKMCAHRASWLLHYGEIPDGLEVCHKVCNTPSCVNPDHLALGTREQNVADMAVSGRGKKSVVGSLYGAQQTPCGNFHSRVPWRGKTMCLGVYGTAEEASAVAKAKRDELHKPYADRKKH